MMQVGYRFNFLDLLFNVTWWCSWVFSESRPVYAVPVLEWLTVFTRKAGTQAYGDKDSDPEW